MVFILLQVLIPLLRHIPQIILVLLIQKLHLIFPVLFRNSLQTILQGNILLLKSSLQVGIMYNQDQRQTPLVYELVHTLLKVLEAIRSWGPHASISYQRDQHLYDVLQLFEFLGSWVFFVGIQEFEAVSVEYLVEVVYFGDFSKEFFLFCKVFEYFQLEMGVIEGS